MKKKTLLLALIVTLSSLTGCKVSTPSELDSGSTGTGASANESADRNSGRTSDNSTGKENSSGEGTDNTVDWSDASTYISYIDDDTFFVNQCKDTPDKILQRNYLYLPDKKELISLEEEDLSNPMIDYSGYLVAYRNGIIKNIKTNEVYTNPDEGLEYIKTINIKEETGVFADDGTVLIAKTVADFDKVSRSFGVLNNDGTWKTELSDGYDLAKVDCKDLSGWRYHGNGYVYYEGEPEWDNVDDGYFNLDHNCYVCNDKSHYVYGDRGKGYGCWFDDIYVYSNKDTAYFLDWSGFRENGSGKFPIDSLIGYNTITNTSDILEKKFYGYCIPRNRYVVVSTPSDGNPHIAYDMETGERIEFDVSGYKSASNLSVVGNTYLFGCLGADKETYITAVNPAGEKIIEPKKMTYECTVGSKFLCTVDGVLTMFDAETGAETALPGKLASYPVFNSHDNNIIVINTDNGNKLLDLNDPQNPFSPFDKN